MIIRTDMKDLRIILLRIFVVLWSLIIFVVHYVKMSDNLLEEHSKEVFGLMDKLQQR